VMRSSANSLTFATPRRVYDQNRLIWKKTRDG